MQAIVQWFRTIIYLIKSACDRSPETWIVPRPAVLGVLTPTKDPYMEYGIAEANKLVTVDILDLPQPVSLRSPAHFAANVQETLNKREIAIRYAEGSFGPPNPKTTWPEMRISAWRDKVMALLPGGEFSPPDDLDDWTYSHYPMAHPQAFDQFLMSRYPMIANCYIKLEELDEWKRLNPEYVTQLFTEWNSEHPKLVPNHSRR